MATTELASLSCGSSSFGIYIQVVREAVAAVMPTHARAIASLDSAGSCTLKLFT